MKPICFDLRGLQPGFKGHFHRGLGRVCQGIAYHLPQAAPDLEFVGLIQANLPAPAPEALAGCDRLAFPQPLADIKGSVRILGQEMVLPRFLKDKVSLVCHIAHLDASAFPSVPTVAVVPDLIMLRGAGRFVGSGPHRKMLRWLETRAARQARRLLAISSYTAQEVVEYLGVPPERVKVVHLAAGPEFRLIEGNGELTRIRERYQLNSPFFLAVGGFDARKNLPRVIRAFGRLLRSGQWPDLNLALAGSTSDEKQVNPVKEVIVDQGLTDRVKLLGFVPDEDLAGLYNLATGLVFGSFYEGFGLPALEAMACGCPVAVSGTSSLPEVVEQAGLYFEPDSEAQIADTLARLVKEPDLRARLRALGLEQAKKFSWTKTAELTAEAFREVIAEQD